MAEELTAMPPRSYRRASVRSRPSKSQRGSRKTRVGEVISSAMNKTIVVRSVTRVPHPKFGKIVKQMKKFYAHDEENKAKNGDTVRIMETRPLSKLKRWRLVEDGAEVEVGIFMVQIRSRLDVADNTGARMATMIGVIGKGHAITPGSAM